MRKHSINITLKKHVVIRSKKTTGHYLKFKLTFLVSLETFDFT